MKKFTKKPVLASENTYSYEDALNLMCQETAEGLTLRELFEGCWDDADGDYDGAFHMVECAFGNFETPSELGWGDVADLFDEWVGRTQY